MRIWEGCKATPSCKFLQLGLTESGIFLTQTRGGVLAGAQEGFRHKAPENLGDPRVGCLGAFKRSLGSAIGLGLEVLGVGHSRFLGAWGKVNLPSTGLNRSSSHRLSVVNGEAHRLPRLTSWVRGFLSPAPVLLPTEAPAFLGLRFPSVLVSFPSAQCHRAIVSIPARTPSPALDVFVVNGEIF